MSASSSHEMLTANLAALLQIRTEEVEALLPPPASHGFKVRHWLFS